MQRTPAQKFAHGLAWFGIGLGIAELCMPRKFASAIGLNRHPRLIQAFGIREIASGVMVLGANDPEAMVWTRVAGDGLDAALLASGLVGKNPNKGRTWLATLLVAPIVVLDCLIANKQPASR